MGRSEQPPANLTTQALGQRVRERRKALGLTQREAAGLCGVGERFLREVEQGKQTAEIGKVLQLLRGLGLRLRLSDSGSE